MSDTTHTTCNVRISPPVPNLLGRPSRSHPIGDINPADVLAGGIRGKVIHNLLELLVLLYMHAVRLRVKDDKQE